MTTDQVKRQSNLDILETSFNTKTRIQTRNGHVKIQLPLSEASTQTDECLQSEYLFPNPFFYGPSTINDQLTSTSEELQSGISAEDTMSSEHSQQVNGKTGFVSENFHFVPVKKKSVLSSYLIALRPWSFTASFTPVALGSCLAYKSQGAFNISVFFTAVFIALCVHAAGNLVNTYFDFVRGVDNKKSDDRTLVDNILLPNDVVTLGVFLYIAGCAGFLLLNVLSPAKLEHLALIYFCGLSSSFFYTGGLGLKYIALGDLLIVLTFGPVTVVFAYLSQTGQLSLVPLIYAIPLALNTEAILHCNNTRDMDSDRLAGAITLAIILGKTGSYCLFCFLLFAPYLLFVIIGVNYSPWILLPALSILLVFNLEKEFRRGELSGMPHKVARLNIVMGSLYILAVYMADPGTLPTMTPLGSYSTGIY
ncbi:unnamed protein product [Lymnaea stagnalis]|uniref:UbiA prenyltransferase domain-containing protein 1 n=1 Tax=Lymnaea stagnalis TaxID=6523 RepID=A0AAV2H7W3_LYMST